MAKPSSPIYPIYFLYGPEDYLIEEEIRRLLDRTLTPKERAFNLHVFHGVEHNAREIIEAARTLPMFSQYRFVLIREADQFDEKEAETLLSYLRDPSPKTCFAMQGLAAGPWKRHQKEIEKVGKVAEFQRLKGKGLVSWVRKRMEEKGKSITEEAAGYLVEMVGDRLQELENGLEKAFLSIGTKKVAELSDIEGITSYVKISTVFDLTDAIGRRDLERALSILEKALESKSIPFKKEEPVPKRKDDPVPLLIGMMSKHYWNMLRAKTIASNREDPEEISKALRMPAWSVRKLREQGRGFSETALRKGILQCYRTDVAIKSGRGPKTLLMEKLVIDLCRPR
jgi:DNA polymerase-3 subunit delta